LSFKLNDELLHLLRKNVLTLIIHWKDMGIFNFLFKRSSQSEQKPVKLTSYMEAAELICKCWNDLDAGVIEPYLSKNILWKGETHSGPLNVSGWAIGRPITINGKQNYLKYLEKAFNTLRLLKDSHCANIVCENGEYRARISIDNQDEDEVYRLKIEDGLITEIQIMPSFEWWNMQIESSPFGVISQTSFREEATAVAAIEQYVKTELNNKSIIWAKPYELRNSHCQLSFTCDGLSYDLLVEIHSYNEGKCRFVMKSEFDRLKDGCRINGHIPCILAINSEGQFVSLTLLDDFKVRIQTIRNKGINEWTFRQLFKTKAQLSRLVISKDYHILLPDYNDIEVKMEPLVKAVYFLFLNHPKGIAFKELADYREELLNIYKRLKPLGLNKRTIQSIEDVTNPLLNSINEKCARIRSAFVKEFDEGLAKNYFVTGERGEAKKIILPRDLVIWEND
jgi:hypothetical protein